MSTTTQILFNSPALHSLKRDQLVKLCKIHSLKASGKKKELIERLQLHSTTLPPDDPLSIATRRDNADAKSVADSEEEASDYSREGNTPVSNNKTRSTEQWEVVMDTIAEVDEETLRSNRGASDQQADVGEFGTHTSKASVTSSLRAIANSLGLKRNVSKTIGSTSSSSSLSSKEVQSSSTLPTSDPSGGPEGPPVEPIPGQSNLQGRPAPSEARLSFSEAPATTTIRLVSNPAPELLLSPPKLQPFATSFDLVPCTPGGAGSSVSVWPLSPGGATRESLYPSIPTFQGFGELFKEQSSQPAATRYDNSDMDIDVDMPGGLSIPSVRGPTPERANTGPRFNTGATPKSMEKPSAEPVDLFSPAPKPQNASTRSRLDIARSEPFVFGSPLPQHNMSNLQFRTAAQSVLDEMNNRLAKEGVEAVDARVLNNGRTRSETSTEKQESRGSVRAGDMFDKIHQKEFDRMDSIASHYAAKRGAQNTAPQPILSKKRKSSLAVKERKSGAPAARHRPNGSRVASGASVRMLPDDFGEEGDCDKAAELRLSKRPRIEREESDAPAQFDKTSVASPPDPEEEARRQKEREAIRRRLEQNKARRRSSMGRPSLGHAPTPKTKPARLGFFASAKSLVQNVWNRGAGSRVPSNVAVSKPAQQPPKTTEIKRSIATIGASGEPSLNSQTKRIQSGSSNTSVQPDVPVHSTLASPPTSAEGGGTVASTRTWRPPIPSFHQPSSLAAAKSSTVAGYAQSNKRNSSLVGFSSLGKKTGPSANDIRVLSTETKPDGRSSGANLQKPAAGIPRLRTTSTLMAPTASSLAKINNNSRIPISTATHNENSTLARAYPSFKQRPALSPQPSSTLEQITNSPQDPAHSARPKKIFSQPLSPTPARPVMSLTTAATNIVGQAAPSSSKPPLPPKPKVLPGRKPRISRSKVIARLASQRAGSAGGAGSSASAGTERAGGKVRSSMGAEAAGKARQSYGGAKGGEVLMSAKKRVRQSEQARRRSRAIERERRMGVD